MHADIDPCEPVQFCADADDYRPVQSTLLTRFALASDACDAWRTTNQDYGAFYYRNAPHHCMPDSLKAKTHRRHHRFQDWMFYQAKCQSGRSSANNNNNNNNTIQSIFPSSCDQTVRIVHRKRFAANCDEPADRNSFSPCGEDGLILDYLVRRIVQKLQCMIEPNEYCDVVQCAQALASDILTQEPSLCADQIIERVVNTMITPPCPSPQPLKDDCLLVDKPACSNEKLPVSTCVTVPIADVFDRLTDLENAIGKISGGFAQA